MPTDTNQVAKAVLQLTGTALVASAVKRLSSHADIIEALAREVLERGTGKRWDDATQKQRERVRRDVRLTLEALLERLRKQLPRLA